VGLVEYVKKILLLVVIAVGSASGPAYAKSLIPTSPLARLDRMCTQFVSWVDAVSLRKKTPDDEGLRASAASPSQTSPKNASHSALDILLDTPLFLVATEAIAPEALIMRGLREGHRHLEIVERKSALLANYNQIRDLLRQPYQNPMIFQAHFEIILEVAKRTEFLEHPEVITAAQNIAKNLRDFLHIQSNNASRELATEYRNALRIFREAGF
jgi:hypothetical protein